MNKNTKNKKIKTRIYSGEEWKMKEFASLHIHKSFFACFILKSLEVACWTKRKERKMDGWIKHTVYDKYSRVLNAHDCYEFVSWTCCRHWHLNRKKELCYSIFKWTTNTSWLFFNVLMMCSPPKSTNKIVNILRIHYMLKYLIPHPLGLRTLQLHFDHHKCREVKEEKGRARNSKDRKKHASITSLVALRHSSCRKYIYIQTYNQCLNKFSKLCLHKGVTVGYSLPHQIQILVLKVDKPWKHLLQQHFIINMDVWMSNESPIFLEGRLNQVLHIQWLLHSGQHKRLFYYWTKSHQWLVKNAVITFLTFSA